MTSNLSAARGKSNAVNPLVRFEAKTVFLARPRRGARLCTRILLAAGVAAAAFSGGAAKAEPAREAIVFVSAHQDDIISSIGTMLLMKDRFDLHVVDYTDGGIKPELIPVRREEEAKVCAALGAKMHYIDEHDGDAYVTPESVGKLEKIFRELKPRAVFAHWPIDVHSDHVMSFAAMMKAARRVDAPFEMYFFQYTVNSKNFPASIFVDISSVADEKWRLIRLYESQNRGDAMCQEELITSRRLAVNMWPPKREGYAEAFAPVAGRAQGPSVFAELPRPATPCKFPAWGR